MLFKSILRLEVLVLQSVLLIQFVNDTVFEDIQLVVAGEIIAVELVDLNSVLLNPEALGRLVVSLENTQNLLDLLLVVLVNVEVGGVLIGLLYSQVVLQAKVVLILLVLQVRETVLLYLVSQSN